MKLVRQPCLLLFALGVAALAPKVALGQDNQTLTVGRWINSGGGGGSSATYSNSDADTTFSSASNLILADSDGATLGDEACPLTLSRRGSVLTVFGSGSDGNISSQAEFNYVNGAAVFLKVVPAITFCGQLGNWAGCTNTGYKNSVLVTQGGATGSARGTVLAHEYGHSTGLAHHTGAFNFMQATASAFNVYVQINQCIFTLMLPVDGDGPGGISGPNFVASDVENPSESSSDESLDFSGIPIETLARSHIVDVMPVEVADFYGPADLGALVRMLNDANELEFHATIATLIGLLSTGSDKDADVLIGYAQRMPDRPSAGAAVVSLGYVGELGSKLALDFLTAEAGNEKSLLRATAVVGLGLTGKAKALERLRGLEAGARRADHSRPPRVQVEAGSPQQGSLVPALEWDTVSEAITANQAIASNGRRVFYGRASR